MTIARRMDRDLLNMASTKQTANATLGTLNALQNWEPQEQLLAAAIVFLNLADFWQVSAQDAFTAATNMLNDKDGKTRPEFLSVKHYMEGELR